MLEGILGAPYKVLLGFERRVPKLPPFKKFFSAAFFWGNAYLAVRFIDYFFIGSAVLANVAPRPMALILEALFVLYILYFVTSHLKWPVIARISKFAEKSVEFFALPHDWIIRKISVQPMNPAILEKCKRAFKERYEIDIKDAGSHAPWLSYLHVRRESESLDEMAGSLLRQYAFSRNISTGFYIAFFYCFGWMIAHGVRPGPVAVWNGNAVHYLFSNLFRSDLMLFMPLLYFFAAVLMLARYYYLYGHYHAQFVFRSFVELDSSEPAA